MYIDNKIRKNFCGADSCWVFRVTFRYCVCISQLPDCLYLGNKCDLEQERQVKFEEACKLAKERGILAALETSAKVMSALTHVKHGGEVLKLVEIVT